MFDMHEHLDELRRHESSWIIAERERALREQRRWELRVLLCTRVLDERGKLGPDLAAHDGVSETTVRRQVDTARALESLPHVAAAAHDGLLSAEQLAPTVQLADEGSDAEWAQRAVDASPVALQRMVRAQRTPSREESLARRNARSLRMWRDEQRNLLCGHFELPLEHGGALVEQFFGQVVEKMRPATGETWDSLEHRQADVLVALCQMEASTDGRDAEDRAVEPTLAARVDLHVDIPQEGPATLCGVPLPDEWVDAARANARVHLRVVDDAGVAIVEDRARTFVSDKRRRAILRRDGQCRWPGCRRRLRLQVHHLDPSSWGGPDDPTNLAAVCEYHHGLLIPHGDYVLEGNPNLPDGLTLRKIDTAERRRTGAPAA